MKCPKCGTTCFQHADLGRTHKCHICGKVWSELPDFIKTFWPRN